MRHCERLKHPFHNPKQHLPALARGVLEHLGKIVADATALTTARHEAHDSSAAQQTTRHFPQPTASDDVNF